MKKSWCCKECVHKHMQCTATDSPQYDNLVGDNWCCNKWEGGEIVPKKLTKLEEQQFAQKSRCCKDCKYNRAMFCRESVSPYYSIPVKDGDSCDKWEGREVVQVSSFDKSSDSMEPKQFSGPEQKQKAIYDADAALDDAEYLRVVAYILENVEVKLLLTVLTEKGHIDDKRNSRSHREDVSMIDPKVFEDCRKDDDTIDLEKLYDKVFDAQPFSFEYRRALNFLHEVNSQVHINDEQIAVIAINTAYCWIHHRDGD